MYGWQNIMNSRKNKKCRKQLLLQRHHQFQLMKTCMLELTVRTGLYKITTFIKKYYPKSIILFMISVEFVYLSMCEIDKLSRYVGTLKPLISTNEIQCMYQCSSKIIYNIKKKINIPYYCLKP